MEQEAAAHCFHGLKRGIWLCRAIHHEVEHLGKLIVEAGKAPDLLLTQACKEGSE